MHLVEQTGTELRLGCQLFRPLPAFPRTIGAVLNSAVYQPTHSAPQDALLKNDAFNKADFPYGALLSLYRPAIGSHGTLYLGHGKSTYAFP